MGKGALFGVLQPFLSREPGAGEYEGAGERLGIGRRGVAVAVFRLRRQFQEMVRAEVAEGLRDKGRVEEELRFLAEAL